MEVISIGKITIDKISLPGSEENNISLSVLRLDKIHPVVSGNKWFKLRYYIDEALFLGKKTIVTFGGAWSNHIIATAAACKMQGLSSIGIIRGEKPAILSATLLDANRMGMTLHFISRKDYTEKTIPPGFSKEEYYFINEGGYGKTGAGGAATITQHFKQEDYTHICCAVGTGTMMAGLINSGLPHQKFTGISVMKNNTALDAAIRSLLHDRNRPFDLLHDYHFGGYAKTNVALIHFMNEFYTRSGIPSDIVYTGKLFYAAADLVRKNYFPPASRVLLIHSGGLQGNASLHKNTLIF